MTQTFYRLHATEHEFSAAGAYSALWGSVWSEDCTQTECTSCYEGDRDNCRVCGGTGWEDALEGYSCCDSEPLATPTRIIEETTWSQFQTRAS